MQESAQAAVSHIRSDAVQLGVDPDFLNNRDLHVHVPAGAIPKDGPSAGVTMATAILSAATGRPVREDVAMTGEITLSGLVLPVGGIREKALAARRFGIRTVILPSLNEPDLEDIPEELRRDMTFVLARTLDDVLKAALPAAEPSRDRGRDRRGPRQPGRRVERPRAPLVYYISGHGFGHASRSIEVINAVLARRPGLPVHIRIVGAALAVRSHGARAVRAGRSSTPIPAWSSTTA